MEARHDWWVRELRAMVPALKRHDFDYWSNVCQAALDYIAEMHEEVGTVDDLCDEIAKQGRVLAIDDLEDMLADAERMAPDDPQAFAIVWSALREWLDGAKAERDKLVNRD